jgi:hypothetical protein
VRPDGYVAAMVRDADPDGRARRLEEALAAWCGTPAPLSAGAGRAAALQS